MSERITLTVSDEVAAQLRATAAEGSRSVSNQAAALLKVALQSAALRSTPLQSAAKRNGAQQAAAPSRTRAALEVFPSPTEGQDQDQPLVPRKRAPSKRPIPDDWQPTDRHTALAASLHVDCDREAAQFRDHHAAKGSVFAKPDLAFNTWLRNAVKWGGTARASPNGNGRSHEPCTSDDPADWVDEAWIPGTGWRWLKSEQEAAERVAAGTAPWRRPPTVAERVAEAERQGAQT